MLREKLSMRPWYPYAMGGCVVVLVYVLLTHVGSIYGGFRKILGYFSTVFLAAVLAYLMNPMANFYSRRVLRRLRSRKLRKVLANALAVLSVVLFFALALVLLVIVPVSFGVTRILSPEVSSTLSAPSFVSSVTMTACSSPSAPAWVTLRSTLAPTRILARL